MQNKYFISKFLRLFFPFFDILLSCLIIGPLVVIYWVTTWKLCDIFITPDDLLKSATISFVIGFIGQIILVFYQDSIAKVLKFENRKFINLFVSKVYALVVAQTSIHFWRGVWKFVDIISSSADTTIMTVNLVQNLVILMLSKTLINSLAVPFVVTTDQKSGEYTITTYNKRVVNKSFQ